MGLQDVLIQLIMLLAVIDLQKLTEVASIITSSGVGIATLYLTAVGGKLKKNIGDTKELKVAVEGIKTDVATLNTLNTQQHIEIGSALQNFEHLTKPLRTQVNLHNAIDTALEYSYEYAKDDLLLKGILQASAVFYMNMGSYLIDNQFMPSCKDIIHTQDVNLFLVQKNFRIALPETWEVAYDKFSVLATKHVKAQIKLASDPINAKEQRLCALIHVQVQEQLTMLNILLKIDNGENNAG